MIGVVHRSVSSAPGEVMAIGPVPVGMVVTGVWMLFGGSNAQTVLVGIGVSESGEENLANASSALGLIRGRNPTSLGLGFSSFAFVVLVNTTVQFVMPLYFPVRTGPVWVLVEWVVQFGGRATAGLIVEPERVVQASLARSKGARRGPGTVMDELRLAAEVARA